MVPRLRLVAPKAGHDNWHDNWYYDSFFPLCYDKNNHYHIEIIDSFYGIIFLECKRMHNFFSILKRDSRAFIYLKLSNITSTEALLFMFQRRERFAHVKSCPDIYLISLLFFFFFNMRVYNILFFNMKNRKRGNVKKWPSVEGGLFGLI